MDVGCTESQEATARPEGGAADEVFSAGFGAESVELLRQLPAHRLDAAWHDDHHEDYERFLHRPMRALLAEVREKHVQLLSAEVAAGRRQLNSLRKNGYGRGAYHDHCRFAFYDPAVASKARSPQLYFQLDGASDSIEFGFAAGAGTEAYLQRLRVAVRDAPDAVSEYLRGAPEGARVVRQTKDHAREWTVAEWRERVRCDASVAFGPGLQLTGFSIRRTIPLSELPRLDEDGRLADEVGATLAWAWPFFEASRTGRWPLLSAEDAGAAARRSADAAELDERAVATLEELSDVTSLPLALLRDMEDALLAQHQIVLTGPPGTSKTFVARQFARYFARQRAGQPQGLAHTLYMHASWAYEDFFEGLRPVDQGGRLVFEHRPGQFLKWVTEELCGHHPAARHVLVLDELNRCDTAAVLGELLQLLEYRGVTVNLLSGRPFVFPPNLYLIGTMNSADRSVGRIDLALRRRFFWIDLHPQPEVLARWLAKPGNNPVGFSADALHQCNELLGSRGVPPEQQVGHALFMGGGAAPEAEEEGRRQGGNESALTEKRLRQVVQFGVLPYVRELARDLVLTHPGRSQDDLIGRIESLLLGCLG